MLLTVYKFDNNLCTVCFALYTILSFMPVTKTAKRALRSSSKKRIVNKLISEKLEVAIRLAKKTKSKKDISKAISLTDRASKKNVIHKNKASRIKGRLSKLNSLKSTKKVGVKRTTLKKSSKK
jgi:small subunit ribosomal protein S20